MARIPFRPCRPSPSGRLARALILLAAAALFADWTEQFFTEGITAGCR